MFLVTDSTRAMVSHVALRVRLVYEAVPAESHMPVKGSDIPGWDLIGLVPEGASPGDAGVEAGPAPGRVDGHAAPGRFASDPMELALNRDEADGYYLNLTSPQPSLFALMQLPDVASATAAHASESVPVAIAITASYNEASRWMDGGMVVIRTPLPEPLLGWIAAFAQHHFKVEVRRKGGKVRPSFLSRQQFGEVARAAREESDRIVVSPDTPRH